MKSDYGHDFRSGDDCKASRCSLCRFKSELTGMISYCKDEPEHTWHKKLGHLTDLLFDAVWALHRTRRTGFTDEHDEVANEWDAANNLATVYVALDELRQGFDIPPIGEPVPEGEEG